MNAILEAIGPASNADPGKAVGLAEASTQLDLSPAGIERVVAETLHLPQAEMPLRHHFAPGICIRELTMPAGTLVIGHHHRFADLNIMLTGRLTLLNADGSLTELVAPQTFVGQPGQKIAYIHETVIWQNVWPLTVAADGGRQDGERQSQTAATMELPPDVDAVEAHYLDLSRVWLADRQQRLAVQRLAHQADRESYADFLEYHELPAADVRRISEISLDLIPLPAGSWKFRVGESAIEGQGILATAPIKAGEVIGPARIAGKRTPLGRYTNHAAQPNAEIVAAVWVRRGADEARRSQTAATGWELVLVALRDIAGAHGGQPGEEITVSYEQVLQANCELAAVLAKMKGKTLCQPQS